MRKLSLRYAALALVLFMGAHRIFAAVTQSSVDVPKALLDVTTTTSVLAFSVAGTMTDANVAITLTHTWNGDLDVTLSSAAVGAQALWSDCGGSGDNFNITIDDDSATPFPFCAPAIGSPAGVMMSESGTAMTAFDGTASAGTWTLSFLDDAAGDTGTLTAWSLTLDGPPPLPVELMNFDVN